MCGICGVLNYGSQEPVSPDAVERMTGTMVHRGPDDAGYTIQGPCGLGMRRLSIIDLSGGHQPITNEDRSAWIVFNGEIYNYLELRRELLAAGHQFTTHSDTEVILHAYDEWGDDCVLRLNGIFGLAIWDVRRRRLLLARDHFGVKPLYYLDDGARLLWGSEIKAILADPRVTPETDTDALNLFLTFRFVPSPHSMFRGICKLRPGHRLIHENGASRVERYWTPRPVPLELSDADTEHLLQERLEAAVRRQMISDVPVGALLSGGVDSAAVVALMRQGNADPIRTFTVGFRGRATMNEIDEAKDSARFFGTQHTEVLMDSVDYESWLQKSVWHMEEPNSTTSALALYFVCRLARESVKVVLTGQGVDEPMGGYHRYYGERYGNAYRHLPAILRDGVFRNIVEALPRRERWKRAIRTMDIAEPTERFARVYAVFSPEMKQALWRPERNVALPPYPSFEAVQYWRSAVDGLHPLMQMAYVDARLSLADDLLMCADKMSMATSVELRVPYLDLEFMAAAEALPPRMRIRGTTRKYIHKRAVRKWLPDKIVNRRKKGFETPIDAWLRTDLVPFVRRTLLHSNSACAEYFSPQAIEALLADHIAGRQEYHRQLFSLLVFELWHQQFVARTSAQPAFAEATF